MAANSVALCVTVESEPQPMVESVRENCRDCKAELWCSRRLHNRLPSGTEFSCQSCLSKRLKDEKESE